jgi:hypothetical protein
MAVRIEVKTDAKSQAKKISAWLIARGFYAQNHYIWSRDTGGLKVIATPGNDQVELLLALSQGAKLIG